MYCTLEIEHNDFTSLTSLAKRNGLMKRTASDSSVWNRYALVVNYCLNYLKGNIFNDNSASQFVLSEHRYTHLTEVPKGKELRVQIPEYSDYSKPPSTLQFKKLCLDKKMDVLDKMFSLHGKSLDEGDVNEMGYAVLKKDVDIAIFLFKKNVDFHPESWNSWDSLGEGYMMKGENELAINSYKKSIELNPKNENGLKMLEKLKSR